MGEVWRASHRPTGETVALKFASRLESASPSSRRRFREEVRAHAALEHPGVARVYDYGEVSADTERASEGELGAGTPYLIMEYAPGGTLYDREPRNWHALHAVLVEILDTLAFAHARGVIHRDLKPSNILWMDRDGERRRPKLADFGLAYLAERRVAEGGEKLVSPTAGTPRYMAPEQFHGDWRMFGPWTDLYQLGAIAWEWATGSPPFSGGEWLETAVKHLEDELPSFEPRYPVPEAFEEWLRRLLEKRAGRRYRRAADAAWDLSDLTLEEEADADSGAPDAEGASTHRPGAPTRRDENPPTHVLGETVGRGPPSSEEGAQREPRESDRAPRTQESDVPPLPASWATPRARADIARLVGVGRGFFGLREVPFVDRDRERDILWETLHEVRNERAPHVVLVDGQAGTGKSRLAEWFVRRAHEVGAAEVFRALHSRQGSPGEGLGGLVEEYFRAWELDRAETAELVAEKLDTWIAPTLSEEQCRRQAKALAHLVAPEHDEGDSGDERGEDLSRFVVLERLLAHVSSERQAVVWLDDLQWGRTALRALENFLERNPEMAVMFVVTVRTPSLEEATGRRLERIESNLPSGRFRRIHLEPMTSADHDEMVRAMLPLTPSLNDRVCDRTEGNPLFAVQLVADWVARDLLVETDEGYDLDTVDASEAIPEASHQIWQRRLDAAFASVEESTRGGARRALRLAAALGRRVDEEEWRVAGGLRGLEIPERLIESLVQLGLAEERPGGWSFVHSMLVDSIERRAREEGEWRPLKRTCAEMLLEMYGESDRMAMRRVEYLLEAEEYEEALEPLDTAMRIALSNEGNRAVLELLERRRDLMDRLGLGGQDRRRVQNWIESAGASRRAGDLERAAQWCERAVEVCLQHDWPVERARALVEWGYVATSRGNHTEGLRRLEAAEQCIRQTDRELEYGIVLGRKVHFLVVLERYEEAHEVLDEAEEIFRRRAPDAYHRFLQADRVRTFFASGEFERARELAEELIENAERDDQPRFAAAGRKVLGELALLEGRGEEARSAFERAAVTYRRIENRFNLRSLDWLFLAADLANGAFDEAARRLQNIDRTRNQERQSMLVGAEKLARAVLAASAKDWEEWDEAVRGYFEMQTPDVRATVWAPWYFELLGDHTAGAGRVDRARRCYAMASHLWSAFGRDERVRSVEQRLENLGDDG